MSGDFKADYKFFKEYHGDTLSYATDSEYLIHTSLSDEFYGKMAGYLEMADWLFGISLVLMVFDVLICFNIISSAIRKNEKENGILRALGFSNVDLFKIYLLQMAFPYVLLIPLVGVAGRIIVGKINESLLTLSLFAIEIKNVIWLLLLCAGIVVISTLLAMIKLFRKQPINVIRTN